MNNTNPTNTYTKNSGKLKYSGIVKQFLLHLLHTSCFPCYKPCDSHAIVCNIRLVLYTVKYVCRVHHMDNEKWPYKTGDLLKELQFI